MIAQTAGKRENNPRAAGRKQTSSYKYSYRCTDYRRAKEYLRVLVPNNLVRYESYDQRNSTLTLTNLSVLFARLRDRHFQIGCISFICLQTNIERTKSSPQLTVLVIKLDYTLGKRLRFSMLRFASVTRD
jgi:hypothetical protein